MRRLSTSLMVPGAVAVGLLASTLEPARAGIPSASNSTVPKAALTCPAGDVTFHIVVRDGTGGVVRGIEVILRTTAGQVFRGCSAQEESWRSETDSEGIARFTLAAGRVPSYVALQVTSGTVLLQPIGGTFSPDQDGDLDVDEADLEIAAVAESLLGAGRSDFNGNGYTDEEDLELIRAHLGHACAPPPPPSPPDVVTNGIWTRVRIDGELPGRASHSAVFDPLHHRIIVMGGGNQTLFWPGIFDDLWELALFQPPTWKELHLSGAPSPLIGHTAIYDDRRASMVVFGGHGPCGEGCVGSNDTWSLDLVGPLAWEHLASTGSRPEGRYEHAAVFDPAGDRMIVLAGFGADCYFYCRQKPLSDVWELRFGEPSAWRLLPSSGTGPSGPALAIHDQERHRLVVYELSTSSFFTLALEEPLVWSRLEAANPPPPRDGFSLVGLILDPVRERALLMQGAAVFALELGEEPPRWIQLDPIGGPIPLALGATAVYDEIADRILVLGGELYQGRTDRFSYPTAVRGLSFSKPPLAVRMDLRAGGSENVLRLGSRGNVVLLVFGDSAFDVREIDVESVRLAGGSAKRRGSGDAAINFADFDRDGIDDAMMFFDVEDLRISPSDSQVTLRGRIRDGTGFVGRDQVRVIVGREEVQGSTQAEAASTPAAWMEELALHGAQAAPEGVRVSCTLPDASAATLELFDVVGRRLATAPLQGEGHHALTLRGPSPLRFGLYFIRLSHGGRVLVGRAVSLR